MSNPSEPTAAPSPPIEFEPIPPTQLVQLWAGMAEQYRESNPSAANALYHCACQLDCWIKHEGMSVIVCMPPSYLRLIHAALHYDPNDQSRVDDLQELCQAACEMQTGN